MIGAESRYSECPLYRDGDAEFLGTRPIKEIPPQADDRFHVVVAGERIDTLAYRYFGRADLWWVIADCNAVFNPMELVVGSMLRIPSMETIHMKVLKA